MAQSKSSQAWLKEHHDDVYVLQARRDGYRSRAVYKLIEIHQKDQVFKPGQFVLDLGAAPGGWCEYAAQFVSAGGRLIAVDLLPVEPIAGAEIIQGDFTEQVVLEHIMSLVGGQTLDLVLSDMAPNLSGMDSVDQPKAMYLAELAVDLALDKLDRNGVFVTKLFQGAGFDAYISTLRQRFQTVKMRKPDASRPRSREVYAVCRGLK
ncbi:MAG: 23S rRNA (uridine(2552)-2'-O)-methyltransferase RlmE [Gammaproteobacteria bacterium]|nr:23S rRNA (uridine(2552)-2'-O)-methyltransferase RlmE [Gammaproteobacteria bacterium]